MLRKFGSRIVSVVSNAPKFIKRHQGACVLGCGMLGIAAASATDTNLFNVITYDDATNSFTYSFTGLLKALVGLITAAMAAGCVLFILASSWRLAKKFVKP